LPPSGTVLHVERVDGRRHAPGQCSHRPDPRARPDGLRRPA
jgi:hypothetical protein